MKLLLLIDVKKLAKKGSIVEVADGYGAFLIQKKMARLATESTIKEVANVKKQKDHEDDHEASILVNAVNQLEGKDIKIKVKVNEKGVLYGNLHALEISEAIKSLYGVLIPPKMIVLNGALKTLGEYKIDLKAGKVKKVIILELVAEGLIK